MFQTVRLELILLYCLFALSAGDTNNSCADWKPYKEEKCVKILEDDGLFNYKLADMICKKQAESNLILIDSEEKQNFLESWLKFYNIVDNVWIKIQHENEIYEWNANTTESHYANWKKGFPKNDSDSCIQIETGEIKEFGKWSNVPCNKKNLVVCEKNQESSWKKLPSKITDLERALNKSEQTVKTLETTVSQLQEELNHLRKEVRKSQTDLSLQGNGLKSEISKIIEKHFKVEEQISDSLKNILPVGFVYAQLPEEKSPEEIWPSMRWKDVSYTYAGVFFRVAGGNAASFGSRQSEDSPRLIRVQRHYGQGSSDYVRVYPTGERSNIIDADDVSIGQSQGISFTVSKAEVRPVNMAIKIWKRVE